jgi:hypothetical protein
MVMVNGQNGLLLIIYVNSLKKQNLKEFKEILFAKQSFLICSFKNNLRQ